MKIVLVAILCVTSVWSYPSIGDPAKTCNTNDCTIENDCRCSSATNPFNTNPDDPTPQLIAITYSESLVNTIYDKYIAPLFFEMKNPDGGKAGFTFYVNHEYTNYTLVNDLFGRGYEIGVHSITKNPKQEYWRNASLEDLEQEFGGQSTILQTFAGIPPEYIFGARTPQLQLEADVSIQAYINSGISYDNSWPATTYNRVLPYTLDYASTQQCTATAHCPVESHPKFWIAPITDIHGANDTECNSLATCLVEGDADTISKWLLDQVDVVRTTNRAPLILRLDSYWFDFTKNSFEGFSKFLQNVNTVNKDVFLVSVKDILDWIHNPVPVSQYTSPVHDDQWAECFPANCRYKNQDGDDRFMGSCVPCPDNYPWKGNPLGD